jgi:TP901 family phage tail tape measure protein
MTIGDLIVNLIVGNEAGMKEELSATAEQAGDAAGRSGSKAMAGSFKKGMGVVAGIAAVALGAFAIGSIDAAKNWETAFAGVKKTLDTAGLSGEQVVLVFDEIEDGLRDMAREIPVPVEELAALAEAGGALGIARGDLMDFTRTAALLGTTTDIAATDAATALGKINAVMPLTREEYSRFAATLVDLGNKGASSESEIVNMAQRMAGAAALIGMSHDELLGWAAAMANVGQEAEAGGSSFQRLALDVNAFVANGGPRLEQVAELAGMTGEAFAALWDQDSNEALRRLTNGLAGLDKNARAAALASLGFTDIRIRAALLALTANVDNLNTSLEVAPEAWADGTAATEEAAKRFATLDSKAQLASAAFNDLMITVGTHLLPVVTDLVTEVTGLVNGITDWIDANPELVSTLTPVLGVLAGLVGLKFGAKLMASLLPLPGAGGVLARALAGVLTTAGADRVLVGASGTLGTRMGTLIQAGLVAGLTVGLAVAIQQAAKGPLEDAADWLSGALGGSGDINISELPRGQVGPLDQGNNEANQAGYDAIRERMARERADRIARAYIDAWNAAWRAVPPATAETVLKLSPSERYFVDAGQEGGLAYVNGLLRGMGIGMGSRPGEAYRINAAWWDSREGAGEAGSLAYRAYAERLVNEGVAFWQAGTGTGAFAPPPGQLIDAVRAAADAVRAGIAGSFDFLPDEIGGATDATLDRLVRGRAAIVQAIGATAGGLRAAIDQAGSELRAARADRKWMLINPNAWRDQLREVEDALDRSQRRLEAAQRSGNLRRIAIEQAFQGRLTGAWEGLTGQAYQAGKRITNRHGDGLRDAKPKLVRDAERSAEATARPFKGLSKDMWTWGNRSGLAWAEGLAASQQAAINAGAGVVKATGGVFRASSPPTHPLNPMRDIVTWGRRTVEAYGDGMRQGVPSVAGVLADLDDMATSARGWEGLPMPRIELATSLLGPVGVDVGEQTIRMVHELHVTPESAAALRSAGFDTSGLAAELGEVLLAADRDAGAVYTTPRR